MTKEKVKIDQKYERRGKCSSNFIHPLSKKLLLITSVRGKSIFREGECVCGGGGGG